MPIPKDPIILLSYANTKLRDEFHSLDELCASLGQDKSELSEKLAAVGYHYDKSKNQFV